MRSNVSPSTVASHHGQQPQVQTELEVQITSRHLLRGILRECSYLPDPYAREWVKRYTISRFRTYGFKAWKASQAGAGLGPRLDAKRKEARTWLTYLKRANEGERQCLRRVLLMTFGRIGKRRNELLLPLLTKPATQPSTQPLAQQGYTQAVDEARIGGAVAATAEAGGLAAHVSAAQGRDLDGHAQKDSPLKHNDSSSEAISPSKAARRSNNQIDPSATMTLTPDLSPPLRALMLSQIQCSPARLALTPLRSISLQIPAVNAWLHPMPQSRIKNKRREHYANIMSRVLPPLPAKEWHYLLGVASGKDPLPPLTTWRSPRVRRSPQQCDVTESAARVHDRRSETALETVLAYGKPPKKALSSERVHLITPRFRRRLYGEILSQCPLMEWDAVYKAWNVTWGWKILAKTIREHALSTS